MSTLLTHYSSGAIRAALGKSIQPSMSAIANTGTVRCIPLPYPVEAESKGEKCLLAEDGGVYESVAEGVQLLVG